MEFNYEYEEKEDRKPVALIDREGDLIISDGKDAFYMFSDGSGVLKASPARFEELIPTARKLFYPGDTLTITF